MVGLTSSPSLTVTAKKSSKSIYASTPPLGTAASTLTPTSELSNGLNSTSAKSNGLQRNGFGPKAGVVGEHKTSITNSNQIGRIANNCKLALIDLNASTPDAEFLATSNGISTANKSVAANLPSLDDPNNLSVEALGVLIQYLVFHVSAAVESFFLLVKTTCQYRFILKS